MEKTDILKDSSGHLKKSDRLHYWLTCNIHFSSGQRSQVRRGECVKTPSIHLGHTVPSVEFVVEIQTHLNGHKDLFNAVALLLKQNPFDSAELNI